MNKLEYIPENKSLNSFEEAEARFKIIWEIVKQTIKDSKRKITVDTINKDLKLINPEYSISNNHGKIMVFVIGTKRAGSYDDMNNWKTIPLFNCQIDKYSNTNEWYLNMEINFHKLTKVARSYWRMNNNELVSILQLAIKNSTFDFVENRDNTL